MAPIQSDYGSRTVRLWYEYGQILVWIQSDYGPGTIRLWFFSTVRLWSEYSLRLCSEYSQMMFRVSTVLDYTGTHFSYLIDDTTYWKWVLIIRSFVNTNFIVILQLAVPFLQFARGQLKFPPNSQYNQCSILNFF